MMYQFVALREDLLYLERKQVERLFHFIIFSWMLTSEDINVKLALMMPLAFTKSFKNIVIFR